MQRRLAKHIDLDNPEKVKGGNARALKLKKSTLAMLKEYVAKRSFKLN